MAAWSNSITFTEPAGLGALVSGLSSLATAANATLDASQAALDAAKVFLTETTSPQAAAAQALVSQADGLLDMLFGGGFYQLVVHPWTPGVGRGQGPWRHLDFPSCVRAMAESFDDTGDPERPRFSSGAAVEMVALVAGAPSPAIFRQVLEALGALTGSSEFRLAQRRLEQAFTLEAERYVITEGSRQPDWKSATVREALPALAPLEAALRENLALLEGYASGGDKAADITSALITAKRAQLTALQDKLATAMALFGQGLDGVGVYALHASGTGGNALLQNELLAAAGAPGPELSFCAGVCWVGVEGGLAGMAGVLGV